MWRCSIASAAFVAAFVVSASAQTTDFARLDPQLVKEVQAAANQALNVVANVKLESLPLDYREGKLIETALGLVRQASDFVDRTSEDAVSLPRLSANVHLLLAFRELDVSLDNLSSLLASPIIYSENAAVQRAMGWAQSLLDLRKGALGAAWKKLDAAVKQTLAAADSKLLRCPQ